MFDNSWTRPNMLLVLMCVMMKILEYSSGTVVDVPAPGLQEDMRPRKAKRRRKRRLKRGRSTVLTRIFFDVIHNDLFFMTKVSERYDVHSQLMPLL